MEIGKSDRVLRLSLFVCASTVSTEGPARVPSLAAPRCSNFAAPLMIVALFMVIAVITRLMRNAMTSQKMSTGLKIMALGASGRILPNPPGSSNGEQPGAAPVRQTGKVRGKHSNSMPPSWHTTATTSPADEDPSLP